MYSFDKALAWMSFCLVSICIMVGPWIFGAWEAWFFWPLVTLIFLSTFAFSLRLFLKAYRAEVFGRAKWRNSSTSAKIIRIGFLSYAVFLIYAFVRAMTSEVYVDAERSFLMLLTPFLIGAQIVFSFTHKQNRSLFWMICANLFLLGTYGTVNHLVFNNSHTMWLPGEAGYQVGFFRATGSYVCPDHFSGIMELTLGIGLALALTKAIRPIPRSLGGCIALIGLAGIFFSKSRGGGLTVLVMIPAILLLTLFTWSIKQRIYLGSLVAGFVVTLIMILSLANNSYATRFRAYFASSDKDTSIAQKWDTVRFHLKHTARATMYSVAYRAWQTSPLVGIGPGMHQNLWPHFAASPDGNRETKDWPSHVNNRWYSYEVHNDWLQLMEEYGIIGLMLFFMPFTCLILALASIRKVLSSEESPAAYESAILSAAILALVAMSFHSLGDFNMQMPATAWTLAAILALPLHQAIRPDIKMHGQH